MNAVNENKLAKKPNRTVTILATVVVLLSCAFLSVGALALYLIFNSPMAERMTLTNPNAPVAVPTAVAAVENKPQENLQKPAETCGNTGSMLVLFTGEDYSFGKWPQGADSVRVAKFDFDNKKITVVAFPRDLWVKTPSLAEQKYPETTLGLSYYYKKEATNGSDQHKVTVATQMVAQALLDNFGLTPERYLTMQLDTAPKMIDTIGGLEMTVPYAIKTEYGEVIPAGKQTMNGHVAIEYARTFVEGDAARLKRQNVLVQALQNKILSANIISKVPDLYKQFDKAVVTDLSPKQIADLVCMAKEVPQSAITFKEIGGDLVTARKDGWLDPNFDKIKAALKEWFGLK